jgi:hypothetical protein
MVLISVTYLIRLRTTVDYGVELNSDVLSNRFHWFKYHQFTGLSTKIEIKINLFKSLWVYLVLTVAGAAALMLP